PRRPGYGPGGPRRPGYGARRPPVKRSWWRTWTWKKALIVAGSSFFGLILLMFAAGFYMYSVTPVPSQALASAVTQNSTVYFNDGKTVVGTFGNTHRTNLTYNQIPKIMDQAAMAAEDRSFMTEGGIDPQGMLRAAYDDLTSSGGSLAGGSTITQQFVRNYYADIGTQQTLSRKLKEIFVAMKVAKEKSKQWILTNYLNTIYLGDDAYGVAAAAETYFNEPISKLTTAQAAVLAALIQSPSYYSTPAGHAGLLYHWRHDVLEGLVKMGDLSAQKAASMKFPKMNPSGSQFTGNEPWDAYIMQEVKNELVNVDHISEHQLDTGGLKIKLTVSQEAEKKLYTAVNDNINLIKSEGYTLPSYAMIGAEAINPSNGGIQAIYPGPGMNLPSSKCAGTCQINTTLSAEQVGSSFKPYVLSAAVKQGMNVQTSILNANTPLWVPPFTMGTTPSSAKPMPAPYYKVHNDSNQPIPGAMSNGGSTVQNALAQSSNTAFTDLAHRVGLKPIEQMAEAEGGVDPSTFKYSPGVGIALGINSLTINDQASMMATIDDGGTYHQAHLVGSISGAGVTQPKVKTVQVLTQAQDSQVQYALEKTVVDGTATAANMDDGRPIIGKTGTTTGSKSALFIGGIPQDVLAVGIFTKNQGNNNENLLALGGGGFGGSWPAAIWKSYAESMWASLPAENFLHPQFSGQAWLQLPKPPPPKPKKPKPSPTPTKSKSASPSTSPTPSGIPTAPPTSPPATGFPIGGGGPPTGPPGGKKGGGGG
ncbi:MAG: penicillin-binding protein, partial [Nocardiopsaceae bacterium]|nr:penicillin-binding protein [Nocardiopsaceae bacterium]